MFVTMNEYIKKENMEILPKKKGASTLLSFLQINPTPLYIRILIKLDLSAYQRRADGSVFSADISRTSCLPACHLLQHRCCDGTE